MRAVLLILLALVLGGCGVDPTAPQRAVAAVGPAEGVTVDGSGRVTGRPDVLRVTVGVSVTRPSVPQALDAANSAADILLRALRAQGVAERDLSTRDFTLNPEFAPPTEQGAGGSPPTEQGAGGSPPTEQGAGGITGYTVRNTVEVKLRELPRAGEALDAIVRAGGDAARVEGVGFALEDNAALLEQARAAAFADARSKAEQYAALTERRLGPLLSVSEAASGPPQPLPFGRQDAVGEAAPAVPIAPGEQEVSVTVTARWALR